MTFWNSSAEPIARPPETTILAPESSGRADFTSFWSTKRTLAGDQYVDVARQLLGGGDDLVGVVLQGRVVVVGDDENGHQSTPASFFSFMTRSAADSTLMPPARFGGSVTLTTFRRGAVSTP